MSEPANPRRARRASSGRADDAAVRCWRVAVLLVPLGLQLSACTVDDEPEDRGASTTPTASRVTADWYEVVSQEPGPEVTDATMRRKIEESAQP